LFKFAALLVKQIKPIVLSRYSIKDLEKLSGVKAHTIRIWEKRYGLLEPQRTDTNIRFYDDDQLKFILNVSILLGLGFKISRISHMTDDELNREIEKHLIEQSKARDLANEHKVNGLTVAMIELDESRFNNIYISALTEVGFYQTLSKIIYPFLEKVGIMWGINEINPAQEHFISNLIRQKVIVEIDRLPTKPEKEEKVVLFLPEDELHELGLLVAQYFIRKEGYKTYYLGQNVPYTDLLKVSKIANPDILLTFFVTSIQPNNAAEYIERLHSDFGTNKLWVGSRPELLENVDLPANLTILNSIDKLLELIK
jgi:DNA-binding transcriptional MerR regulator